MANERAPASSERDSRAYWRRQAPTLVQVDIEAASAQSDAGTGARLRFDRDAFGTKDNLRPINPMSATFAIADLTLGRIQLIYDPEQSAETSTTFVGD